MMSMTPGPGTEERGQEERVLFVCTHNAARSQMAEAFLRHLYGDRYVAFSAGTDPGQINPFVVKAMKEIGIDMSLHRPKSVDEFIDADLAYVVTVCDDAREACPYFPGGRRQIHHSFPNPSAFTGTDEEMLAQVRQVRDAIRAWIEEEFGGRDA